MNSNKIIVTFMLLFLIIINVSAHWLPPFNFKAVHHRKERDYNIYRNSFYQNYPRHGYGNLNGLNYTPIDDVY